MRLISKLAAVFTVAVFVTAPVRAQQASAQRVGMDVMPAVVQHSSPKKLPTLVWDTSSKGSAGSCTPFPSRYSVGDLLGSNAKAAANQWALCARRFARGVRLTDVFALVGISTPEIMQAPGLTIVPVSTGRIKLGFEMKFR